jgi:hypothetical protein
MPVEPGGMAKAKVVLNEQTLYRTRPDVSLDGKRFVYSSTRGAADQFSHLYVLPTAGGEPYKLTFGSYDNFHPRWSPDGEWIAFVSNKGGVPQLWVLETYGGEKKRIDITSRRWKRPMGMLRVRVLDESTHNVTPARIYAPASDGKFYAPAGTYSRIGSRRMVRRWGAHYFHTEGEFTLETPSGKMTIEATKGFEYWPAIRDVEVKAGEVTWLDLTVKPMVDMAAKGWRNGSIHAHMNYGGNLRNTLENMMMMSRAEDQEVVHTLVANKDNRILDWQYFVEGGREHPVSQKDPNLVVIVGEEYRPPFWGHVFFIGLRDHLISPFTTGYEGTGIDSLYPSNTDMFRKARSQGAVVGYVHAFGGNVDPLEGSLGGGKALPVDVALETIDGLEWTWSSQAALRVLHHAWNNDFRIAPICGEDANTSLHRHTLLGAVRTYAHLGSNFSATAWIEALKQGKTFMSNGPLLEFRIDGRIPGESLQITEGASVALEAEIWSNIPLARALIYHNGEVWKQVPLTAGGTRASFRETAKISRSGWFSLVAEGEPDKSAAEPSYSQAASNAIRVYVGGEKIRNRLSAEYFIAWIDKLRKMAEPWPGWRSQAEKDKVFAQFEQAKAVYQARAREARN